MVSLRLGAVQQALVNTYEMLALHVTGTWGVSTAGRVLPAAGGSYCAEALPRGGLQICGDRGNTYSLKIFCEQSFCSEIVIACSFDMAHMPKYFFKGKVREELVHPHPIR